MMSNEDEFLMDGEVILTDRTKMMMEDYETMMGAMRDEDEMMLNEDETRIGEAATKGGERRQWAVEKMPTDRDEQMTDGDVTLMGEAYPSRGWNPQKTNDKDRLPSWFRELAPKGHVKNLPLG